MSNELQARLSINIKNGGLVYQSNPTYWQGNVNAQNGPSPGAVTIDDDGTNISLSQLTANGGVVGYGTIQNLDTINYLEYGIWDNTHSIYSPLGLIGPGEIYILRLSPNFGNYYAGGAEPGTASTGSGNVLRLRALDTNYIPVESIQVVAVVNFFQS